MAAYILCLGCALVIVACGILAVGWDRVLTSRENPETEDAYANGEYRPLTARVGGHVPRVLANDNERVHAGDVLFEIEDDN